ncbi:MAG: type II toxin-antitoxin system prevent-host-death family antitoxin [Planctomycetota bacterium]
MTKTTELPVQAFRDDLATHLARVALLNERFVVTKNGKPMAALVSLADLEKLQQLGSEATRKAKRRK